jgi:hypothetical protein
MFTESSVVIVFSKVIPVRAPLSSSNTGRASSRFEHAHNEMHAI